MMRRSLPLIAVPDLLAEAQWECAEGPPGSPHDQPPPQESAWAPAPVPGTVAQALLTAGDHAATTRDYDASAWWYRTRLPELPDGPYVLTFEGLATIADVWWAGEHVLHSENMFTNHQLVIRARRGEAGELLVRFASLEPTLAVRRPRPRWKCRDLRHANLRWIRTTLIGRQTGGVPSVAPVGPWRPVQLQPLAARVQVESLAASLTPEGHGVLEASLALLIDERVSTDPVALLIDGTRVELTTGAGDDVVRAQGRIVLPQARPWWPNGLGEQNLYEVELEYLGQRLSLGNVGFRSVEVDRTDGAFTLSVNGVPIFARGACWTPVDPVSLQTPREVLRGRLEALRKGNHNMVRVTGVGVYESEDFYALCDELGLLVWQDCMLAFFDAPDTDEFADELGQEVSDLLHRLKSHPSLAVICGGSENEQQAAYLGLPPDRWATRVALDVIPDLVAQIAPGTVYVRSTPGESPLPSMVNAGPGHYFGVGAYLRPLEDAGRAGVRFASECLSFANPAEPLDTVEGAVSLLGVGHHPDWKRGIHRDAATSWDLEDVRDLYTSRLFGVDPTELRRVDSERALQVARCTVATVFESVLTQWRIAASACRGALVLQATDSSFGGGLGLLDSLGRPKSSWYAMRRIMQPHVVLLTDEGVNGLALDVVSDCREAWEATVTVELLLPSGGAAESVTVRTKVIDGAARIDTSTLFGGFRDLSYTHRFGPPAYDAVMATLLADDEEVSTAVFLPERVPGARLRPVQEDLGLTGEVRLTEHGDYEVLLSTERLAQWVSLEIDGYWPVDSWFHLPAGRAVTIPLRHHAATVAGPPRGVVRAMNAARPTRLSEVSGG